MHKPHFMRLENDSIMKSLNFEFLRSRWPELAGLGGFAETYAHTDPKGSLAKLRQFGEELTKWIYHEVRLPIPVRANQIELLEAQPFLDYTPQVVLSKLHTLRIEGNRAVHGSSGDTTTALRILKEAHNIARWLFATHTTDDVSAVTAFVEPPKGGVEGAEQRKEKRAILQRLVDQEAQLQKLLCEIANERERSTKLEATAEEHNAALQAAAAASEKLQDLDPLSFNEDQTRRYLIDRTLADNGWDVGAGESNTAEVHKEVLVQDQPTDSTEGYADYVLFDDNGKPLAVIEAKRTSKDSQLGRTQAKLYADGLEKEYGQRPIIFYTNGFETFIWNDAEGESWRRIYGFYSKDSLQHLVYQRTAKAPLSEVAPNVDIAGRMYQVEAVRRVAERFAEKKRKALVVQATGTGKTRVSISLCDALIKAKWAKRVLFLCDRKELRKQAHNAFKEFLPSEPRTIVSRATAADRDSRIYFATYPAMMRIYESFDVGFFDLIIADESHRSLYNRYKQLFQYFDCHQVGLTATPIQFIGKSTFDMFQCEGKDPTASYEFREAIENIPRFLNPFEVVTFTTKFLRDGIKYDELTDEQKAQLEEDGVLPEELQYEQERVDKAIYNKPTNCEILRNLMERGIRIKDGSQIGKTIVFARNIKHARLLESWFREMYPQYAPGFCQVIVSEDPRAESLIDDFKGEGSNPDLTIAISVDMLDTGVDVPEIVNLVFAKPVFSYVKFWQMIGRGTRLAPDLFGPGKDKTRFLIFDHWGNFERFGQEFKQAEPQRSKSTAELLFEARIELAEAALEKQDNAAFELAIALIEKDIQSLPAKSIPVQERWRTVHSVANKETLQLFDAATKATLKQDIAPLMQWRDITGHHDAYRFDVLIARLQAGRLLETAAADDRKDELVDWVSALRSNLSQVKTKMATIDSIKTTEFWKNVSAANLESVRVDLRGVAKYRRKETTPRPEPKILNIAEDAAGYELKRHKVKIRELDQMEMVAYRARVHDVLMALIDESETLRKIRLGQPVDEKDLDDLCSLVLTQEPGLNLNDLKEYFSHAESLDEAIRGIIGMDAETVHNRFTEFVKKHPTMGAHQIKFLDLLQNHIAKFGSIQLEQLYGPPFTTLHSDSLDGLFEDNLAEELFEIIESFGNKD